MSFLHWGKGPTSYSIGDEFERYCKKTLFSKFKTCWTHVDYQYTDDPSYKHNVDFYLKDYTGADAIVECKWNHVDPKPYEYEFYKRLSYFKDVFYLTGIGEPSNPQNLYLVSFKDLNQRFISEGYLNANRIRKAPVNSVEDLRFISRCHPGSAYPPSTFDW